MKTVLLFDVNESLLALRALRPHFERLFGDGQVLSEWLVQVLRSATHESARALGLEPETGALAPGLAADVLVVDGNPLDDLSALLRPKLVLARGRRIDPQA